MAGIYLGPIYIYRFCILQPLGSVLPPAMRVIPRESGCQHIGIKLLTHTQHLLYIRACSKHCVYVNSLNAYDVGIFMTLFIKEGNHGTERFSDSPQVTQLESGGLGEMHTQAGCSRTHAFNHYSSL